MPWTVADVDGFVKGLSRKEKRKWVAVANSSLKTCIAAGGDDATCAPKAIQTASGVVKKDKKKEMDMLPKADELTKKIDENELQENGEIYYVPSNIIDFSGLDAMKATEEMSEEIASLTYAYTQLVNNIVYWFEGDKLAQLKTVSDELIFRLGELLDTDTAEIPVEAETSNEAVAETFAEAEASTVLMLEEDTQPDNVLRMDIAIIRPGWGNKVDNHYYSSEMLRNCAQNFSGAKMYETDHVQAEKNTRTWVSTITDIVGFTEDGAPIGRVAIHDPNFAERVRNLNKAGLLSKMECSIYAAGKAAGGFELNGRKGKQVLEISDVSSVDWVTKAGAGGRALSLAESNGGDTMEENKTAVEAAQPETEAVETTETVVPVKVEEAEAVTSGSEEQVVESTPTTDIAEPEQSTLALAAEVVRSLLDASKLPDIAVARLAKGEYQNETVLNDAVENERQYLSELLNAGKVTGMGLPETKQVSTDFAEVEKRKAAAAERVNKKFFGG
jgi:uncharacterized protein YdaT